MAKFAEPFDARAFAASRPSFSETNVRLLDRLPELTQRWLPGGKFEGREYIVRNPRRPDQRLGSFRINLDSGKWADFATGERGGDAVSLYAFIHSITQHAALRELTGVDSQAPSRRSLAANSANPANRARTPGGALSSVDTEIAARRLYDRAKPVLGSPAETYLCRRGLMFSPAWKCLRFDELRYRGTGLHPCLIAPVIDDGGRLTGVQRTYLDDDGRKLAVAEPKLSLGRIRGGAIRLAEPRDELFICEGLEDGLTVMQSVAGACVWVAAGAGMMRLMYVPPHVRTVIIAADNDPAGEQAALAAAERLSTTMREVRIIRPPAPAKDFNEHLLAGEPK